ncbi:Rid family hydrolase [Azospirillum sp. sgz302134]
MARKLTSSDPAFTMGGCSRALVNGKWVFVPGTTGVDHDRRTLSSDVEEQTRQTMRNIRAILRESDADLEDIVRVRVYLADAADFARVAPILVEQFQDIGPASSTIVCPLPDPRAKIEIEVTARR